MSLPRKAVSVHGYGGRMQVSAMRPLAAAGGGGYRASSGGSTSYSFSSGGGGSGFSGGGGSGFSGGAAYGGAGFGGSNAFGGGGGGFSGSGFAGSFGSSAGGGCEELFFGANEKITMQGLNERLANYLDKVRSLEEENRNFEVKIKEWCSQGIGGDREHAGRDYSPLENEIQELQSKLINATMDNSNLILQIDNAKLAADDFRLKFENELSMRQGVEADIAGLRRVLDELTLSKSDYEMQIESIREELAYLNKCHDEDMKAASSGIAGQVNVELDAAPGPNLMDEMDACRKEYEAMVDKIRRDAEKWYNEKAKDITQSVASDTEAISSFKSEISDLRRTIQSLEIELQTQIGRKGSLESNLAETEGRYGMMIQEIQMKISALEDQLANLRSQMEYQSQEYQMLLGVKQQLEQEIETYRILLEGEDSRHKSSGHGGSSSHGSSSSSQVITRKTETRKAVEPDPVKEPLVTRKVKTIVETVVDGVVQKTEVQELEAPVTKR
ncbi:keratin, type I cytoskeletal 47 kDa-like [Protopterus annectens]|uniref:keratin, type I cytoskeletal 47 kDa-like n=1 Tax=Protopterus annectens TaxID=7888 RepID=UPI001CF9577F|nr:keratin, type I cytoskeletal 47 kDa-like [Protopterus annectens]